MKKRKIVIIGVGRFSTQIVNELKDMKEYELTLIDKSENKLINLRNSVDKIYVGDASNENFLDEINLKDISVFVIGIGNNIESSVLTCSLIMKKFPNSRIIARAVDLQHEEVLKRMGVTEIIIPIRAAAKRAYFKIISPITRLEHEESEIIELEKNISILVIDVKEEWINHRIADIHLNSDVLIVLIKRKHNPIIVNGSVVFQKGDKVFLLGKSKAVAKFIV